MTIAGTLDLQWDVQSGPVSLGPISGTQNLQWSVDNLIIPLTGSIDMRWAIGVTVTQSTVVLTGAPTGLVGQISVSLLSQDGTVTIVFPKTDGIDEVPANTGRYVATLDRPPIGRYLVVWTYNDQAVMADFAVLPDGFLEISGGVGSVGSA